MTSNPRRTRCKRRDDFAAFTTKLVLTLVSCLVVSMYTCYKVPFTKIKMLDLTDGGLSTNNHQNGYGLDTNFVFDSDSISNTNQSVATNHVLGEYFKVRSGTPEAHVPYECIAGVADGDVTIDSRPLLWKLRNEIDVTNDLHYFSSGVEHYPGVSPAEYSYLGMGPALDTPDGPVRQGLNSQGLAVGWNVLDNSGWKMLHHQALGHYNSISQVRPYISDMTDLSTFNYFIDNDGEAALWENQIGMGQHWEYNTRAPARDIQWIDVDNADGDDDYTTGTDITLSGWVVRANQPGHFKADGSDHLGNVDRYKVGREVIGSLIYNNDLGTALSAEQLAVSFFRNDALAIDDTVSSMIVQGVLPTEDPRLSTMWVLLGHSETGIFVPVWLHGVESGEVRNVPQYLDDGDDDICVYTPSKGMQNEYFDDTDVQMRTLPFEAHLFAVINNVILPDWRSRDWADGAAVNTVGEEMKRVQEQMDKDAYMYLKYLYDTGATSYFAPEISIDSIFLNAREATFSVTTYDADDENLTNFFNYGDGQSGSDAWHKYIYNGHYLVSSTVTDEHGISQTDWLFITVDDVAEHFSYLPLFVK